MALVEETMKTRLPGALAGLAISVALPIYAQQKDLADPQTTQKMLARSKAFDEASNNHDAAAIAEQFTRDGVFVTTEGPITGRQAIQKWYTELYKRWHPKNHISKVDGNAFHLIGTAGNELWSTGEFSENGQGKNGEPITIKGYWAGIDVREGDDWKTRVSAFNTTPDSVIPINKSFAPQSAATPSPTDVADPQTTQKVFASFKGFDEAFNNHDAAAVAAFYTRDVVFVTAEGPIIGREALQRWWADFFQWFRPKNKGGKADGNALYVIGTAGKEFWATGDWSWTGQGKNGEPIPIKGYWLSTNVREGDDWKIRVSLNNATPDSVILIKSIAPQPAATPSPTASPSAQ